MKQRRFRNKPITSVPVGDAEDDGEEDGPGIVIGQTSVSTTNQRSKERKERTAVKTAAASNAGQQRFGNSTAPVSLRKSLLSFDEPTEAVGSLQKPKDGGQLKPGRGFKAILPKRDAIQSTQTSAPGEYSAMRLNALQHSTPMLPGRSQPKKETAFKLSGSFKPAALPSDDRFTVNAKDMMKEVQVQDIGSRGAYTASEVAQLPPPPRNNRQAPSGSQPTSASHAPAQPSSRTVSAVGVTGGSSDEEAFSVPDAAAIRRAKEKRERLRSAHLAPDYIPLGGAAGLTATSNQQAAARLRNQQADGSNSEEEEEAEDGVRMQFVGGVRPSGARSVPRGAEGGQDGEFEEDDDDAWQNQQISKGAGRQNSTAPSSQAAFGGRQAKDVFTAAPGARAASGDAASAGPERAVAAGAQVVASLRAGMEQLQASHMYARKQLDRTAGQLQDAISSVSGLESKLSSAKVKYTYMQDKRGYIADLCDMLQMKAPIVEVLEERVMEVAEERSAAAAGSAAADDVDELRAPEAAVAAALGVLSRGGAAPAAQSAAASAAQAADSYSGESLPEQLDEFGRDVNVERRSEALGRVNRRKARHARELSRVTAAKQADTLEAAWGDSTTDEDDDEVARYTREGNQIMEAASTVFADAGEEYADIAAVKVRLEDWQAQYLSAFNDAYMGISAPAIFAPFVRSQLLCWDPLYMPGTGFDSQDWYQQLFDYGVEHEANSAGAPPNVKEDEELIPALVQRIVARRSLHAIEHVWNPLSCKQSAAVAALLKDLAVYLSPDDPIYQEMVTAVQSKLKGAAERQIVPPWPRAAVAASPIAVQSQLRRFGRGVRTLRCLAAFEGAVPSAPLRVLAFDVILTRQLLPFIRGTPTNPALTLERLARCVFALPARWFSQSQDKCASPVVDQAHAISRVLQNSKVAGISRSSLEQKLSKLLSYLQSA